MSKKGNDGKPVHIFFNQHECMAMQLGLTALLEDFSDIAKNDAIPWSPEARKQQKEMITAMRSASAKLEKFAGIAGNLPPYIPGDEDQFLTKES